MSLTDHRKFQTCWQNPLLVTKDCLPYVLPTLTALVNLSFTSSAFPGAWKKSVVVPHLKDGDHEIPNNNRPISLLPVLYKLSKKIALSQFNYFLTQQGNLTCHQSGNRKYHQNPESACYWSHLQRNGQEGDNGYMVLIDLSKAFDSICHRTLLLTFQGLGASIKASKWFESYLTDHMQSTGVGTSRSEEQIDTHGVPQGSIFRTASVQSLHEWLTIRC